MTVTEIFKMYDYAAYFILKYSITVPATLTGNLIDLLTLGVSKNVINVEPLMQKIPFPREATKLKNRNGIRGVIFLIKDSGLISSRYDFSNRNSC